MTFDWLADVHYNITVIGSHPVTLVTTVMLKPAAYALMR